MEAVGDAARGGEVAWGATAGATRAAIAGRHCAQVGPVEATAQREQALRYDAQQVQHVAQQEVQHVALQKVLDVEQRRGASAWRGARASTAALRVRSEATTQQGLLQVGQQPVQPGVAQAATSHQSQRVRAGAAERRAAVVARRRAARARPRSPIRGRLVLDATVSMLDGECAQVEPTNSGRCGDGVEIAESPFAVQAAVLCAMAEDARDRNAHHAEALRRRAAMLHACDDAMTEGERLTTRPAVAGACWAWEAWNDAGTRREFTVGLCAVAGNGVFAERAIAHRGSAPPVAALRGVVVKTEAAAADTQSTVRHVAAEAEGQIATLLGPLAMCNAACALCANLRFTGLGTHQGARTLGVRTTRYIGAHEQMCVYYRPRVSGVVCVLCEEPIH